MVESTIMEKIYENKHAKINAFAKGFVGALLVFVLGLIRLLLSKDKKIDPYYAGGLLAVGALLGIVIGTVNAVRMRPVKIIVRDDQIDVTRGKAHGTYSLEDFIRCSRSVRNNGRSGNKVIRDIVIRGDDGEELYIECDGFTDSEFAKMSDDLTKLKRSTVQQSEELSEDIEVGKRPLLENGRFAGDYEFKLKGINGVLIFFCCSFALLLAVEVLLLFYGKSNALAIKLLLFSIIPLIALLALIYLLKIYIPRSYQKMTVKSLEIGSFDLVINDESIPFSKIQKIEIDDPYLTN
ncbi:MAG: hypothetical protein J5883_02660, partial [Clostridiales bacterium]|nr:hypothetical protein [Clostridiales bacterium]